MSLQFIMGNSGAGKSRYAYQKILAEAMRHPEKTYLIIVPEQFTMQTQKELVSLHPAGGILNVDILSFQRLAYRIFEETGGSLYPVLEETGKSLVVKRVAQEKKKELTILGSTLKRTGAVSQMKSLISELKQYQIAPSELDTWAEETGEKKLLAAKGASYRNIYFASGSEAGKFALNIMAFPTTYVFDRDGNVVGQPLLGGIDKEENLAALQKNIDAALAKDSAK